MMKLQRSSAPKKHPVHTIDATSCSRDLIERAGPLTYGQQKKKPRPSVVSLLLQFFHHVWLSIQDSLEYVGVAISMFDVVSDFVVAYEFYHSGYTKWCYTVLASIFVSSAIYTLVGAEELRRWANRHPVPHGQHRKREFVTETPYVILCMLIFPASQLVPLIHWWYKKQLPVKVLKAQTPYGASQVLSNVNTKACVEELQACAADVESGSQMQNRIKKSLDTHWLFIVETLVESIPQCVLQLLAVSYMQPHVAMSSTQIVSLILSFGSIVSKAHFVSVSPTVRMHYFKAALVVHDVACVFFLSSSILAPQAVPLLPGDGMALPYFTDTVVAVPAALIVWKICVVLIISVFLFFIIWCAILSDQNNGSKKAHFLLLIGFLLSAGAIVVALECARLSLLIPLLVILEPALDGSREYAGFCMTFVSNGKDAHERERRLRHCYNHTNRVINSEQMHVLSDSENSVRLTVSGVGQMFCDAVSRDNQRSRMDKLFTVSGLAFLAVLLCGGFVSLVCTYWHLLCSWRTWGFAQSCFAAIAIASLVSIALHCTTIWWSARTTALMATLNYSHRYHSPSMAADNFAWLVTAYQRPDTLQLLRHCVPAALVPQEVLAVIAALTGPAVDMQQWTTQQLSALDETL